MAEYDGNRAARGQAYNLAVQDARDAGKGDDMRFIAERVFHHLQRASQFQQFNADELAVFTRNTKLLELYTKIQELIVENEQRNQV